MIVPALYRLLENPVVYQLAQLVLAPGAAQLGTRVFQGLSTGARGPVLDVGCGPRASTPPPDGLLVGADVNPDYIRRYTGGWVDQDPDLVRTYRGPRSRLGYVCSGAALPFADEAFDEARCRTTLHHLPPSVAEGLVREMVRCTRPGGKVILIDMVWPRRPLLRPIAWVLMKLDRGGWVRSEEELVRLVQTAVPGQWRRLRYTCTYYGAEAVAFTFDK